MKKTLFMCALCLGMIYTFSVQTKGVPGKSCSVVATNDHRLPQVVTNIVFRSTDGGQTWQDISEGLPENFHKDNFFANESGLYLRAENGIYHSKSNASTPFWKKEILSNEHSSIASSKTGIPAYSYLVSQFLQKVNGTNVWTSMYTNVKEKKVHTVFETAGGTVFISADNGLFKSTNNGETWKQVRTGDWIMKLAESNGVLLATSQNGILRSTDNGENWDYVISEGGMGIAVERIQGGFAAITYNTESKTRRVRASYDGGKTWQPIDAGLPASRSIASIVQVGKYFLCGHPTGIFRSSDKGKTWKILIPFWKLLIPYIDQQVFNLSVSGNVIYAIPTKLVGC